jgi:PAS domain S-box-containing protein
VNSPSRTILIIDDSAADHELYRRYLMDDRDYRYTILEAESGQQGLDLWQQHQPDAVLLDYRLPDCDGFQVLAQLQQSSPQESFLPIVVVTGQGNEAIAVALMKAGAQDYLVKGQITPERLQMTINNVIETTSLRHQMQRQQAESERFYASIAKLSPVGIFRSDRDGHHTYVNDRCCEMMELAPEAALSLGWVRALHPDDRERVLQQWWQLIQENVPFRAEYRFQHVDGTVCWVLGQASPETNEQGQIIGYIGTLTDISDRKQAETILLESEKRLQLALHGANQGIWDWDLETEVLTWDKRSKEIFGLPSNSPITYQWHIDALHPDDRQRVLEAAAIALHRHSEFNEEYRTILPDGTLRWILARGRGYYNKAGEPYRMSGTVLDINDRKEVEEALQTSEERFQTFMNNSPFAAFMKDNTGRLKYVNRMVEQLFNKSAGELVGCNDFDFLPEEIAQDMREHDRQVFATGEATEFVETIPNEAGDLTYWLTIKFPLGNKQDLLGGIAVDISDRVQLERERERILRQEQAAREEAERANRIKDEFLAVLSHELRSPLNPILGWTKLMQSRPFDPTETAAALDTIERSVKVQIQLIDDLLDVAKILRGKLSMTVGPIDLIVVVQAAIETVRTAASAKSIELHPIFSSAVGQITGDGARLQQIVWNLLSNAIKFTPNHGRVEIRLEQIDDQAQITVSDTGKGIKPEFLPHIFESFRQEDFSTTRKFGGLGLGLAIVRSLVEAHGGTIWADSPGEGQGATFTAQFPVLPSESVPAPAIETPGTDLDLTGIRILSVDDDPEARKLLTAILTKFGAEVLTVSSADEVLTTLDAFQPDILVSDIGMPEMDGYGLSQLFKIS